MAYTNASTTGAKARVEELIDVFLAEPNCHAERYAFLCGEFKKAVAEAQEETIREAEAAMSQVSDEFAAGYMQDMKRYETYMTGFRLALDERRRRWGMGGVA